MSLETPSALEALIRALRCLPGVGPKSAQRMAYHLLQYNQGGARTLAGALIQALDTLQHCERCNSFTGQAVCELCAAPRRDPGLLCIVEMPADLVHMEQTHSYPGLYFVLMGRLSPLDGIGPKDIHLDRLIRRALDGQVREVILATNFTAEGEATAHYIGQTLRARGLVVSRIAQGLPLGGEVEHVDIGTLAHALAGRREF